jgi:hypothetical protein
LDVNNALILGKQPQLLLVAYEEIKIELEKDGNPDQET